MRLQWNCNWISRIAFIFIYVSTNIVYFITNYTCHEQKLSIITYKVGTTNLGVLFKVMADTIIFLTVANKLQDKDGHKGNKDDKLIKCNILPAYFTY